MAGSGAGVVDAVTTRRKQLVRNANTGARRKLDKLAPLNLLLGEHPIIPW